MRISPLALPADLSDMLASLSAIAFADEQQCVRAMIPALEPLQQQHASLFTQASGWVESIRSSNNNGIGAFLNTFGLNTREGVAIMCLAEALLRIPDPATADQLIHGTFANTEWSRYLGSSDSFFVNASSWGLLLSGSIVNLGAMRDEKPASLLGSLISRLGEPVIREALKQAVRHIGTQFVMGETIESALANAQEGEDAGYRYSFDMLGEEARTNEQAEAYMQAYLRAIEEIARHKQQPGMMESHGISIKLSALHPRYQLTQETRVAHELLPRLKSLVLKARDAGITVSLDAEESSRFDLQIKLFSSLMLDADLAGYGGLGFVLQAYQKRAFRAVDYLVKLCHISGRRMPVRLVKGAYWDSEIKYAQVAGLPSYPVFTRKEHTDVSYLACAGKLLLHRDCFYPQFATHNALTIASLLRMADGFRGFEIQRLHGMGKSLHDQLLAHAPCRVYAPVGRHVDLLAYLIRRMIENGANSSFVHMLADKDTPLEQLLADPVALAKAKDGTQHEMLPNPSSLYHDRANSRGIDFGNACMLGQLVDELESQPDAAHTDDVVPEMSTEKATQAVGKALAAFHPWRRKPAEERAYILEKAADLLEASRNEAIALLAHEAGKTLPDAVAEVREAADFCRYYAAQARVLMKEETLQSPTGERNLLSCLGRGVFICISPWNFPLAIFTGQVVAALVTGNCVIAKPAEQTPRIADFMVKLLHKAGIPQDVLQLAIGSGARLGAALVANEHIAGVAFTGSVATAQRINQTLAARKGGIIPLIAETGGQNCMIVDSSALPEQVTDYVIQSAFGSAGQRCSALRVLYVQEDIADRLIPLIAGAMQELTLGLPHDPATDIGPVIDETAQAMLQKHIELMTRSARLLAATPLPEIIAKQGRFVAPHMFEVSSISQLPGEVFGPILHVIRFPSGGLAAVCDEINSCGFGLTFGLQSRIEANVALVAERIHAGNLYINRNMIGAVVGVQPFGGEGLSGTGPKAGGPHYLARFITEHTLSVNTAAIGGNLELFVKQ